MAIIRSSKTTIRKGTKLTKEIKGNLLAYYRFVKNYKYIATEAGWWYPVDVIAFNGRSLIEIEVKISKSDLKKELKGNKTKKHAAYRCPSDGRYGNLRVPNKFYICVPSKLMGDALEIAEELNYMYGVITFTPNVDLSLRKMKHRASDNLRVVKEAQNLVLRRNEEEKQKIQDKIASRMSSEITVLRCSPFEFD
jgi:hypothetical protein